MSNAFDHRDAPRGTHLNGNNDPASETASHIGIPEFPKARDERRSQPVELDTRSKIIFWLFRAALNALSLIPDFLLYPLGVVGGFIGYLLDRRHLRIGMKNLEIAFPEKSEGERRRILRASYLNLGRGAAEYIRLSGFFYRRLRRRVSYKGLSNFAQAVRGKPGKGIIALSAHFGNFELLLSAQALHGYQIGIVHHTQRFLAGDALMSYVRERAGVDIMRKHSAARAVLRALKDGDLVGIPFDQNAKRSEAIFVPFFGEPAATISGLARLAMSSGAPVVPVFIVRQLNRRSHCIQIYEELAVQRTGDLEVDLLENTRRFVKAIEDIVRRYPDQFLWTHRRYRTRPRGMAPVYDWEVRHRPSGRAPIAARAGQRPQQNQHADRG
ncbi:MAG: lysophospholipid acyltransferase family protein [Candidatus Binataceae bacterium]